jgi:hypothetical protein
VFITQIVKGICALSLAAALTITLAPSTLAAVSATLSPTAGQPGDAMTLTTTEWVSAGPVYLVSAGDFQAEIIKFGGQVCGVPGQHYLGKLTQIGDTGYLSFRLPDVPAGDYYFELRVQTSGSALSAGTTQCWRVGASGGGPLVLSVTNHTIVPAPSTRVAAAAQRPQPVAVQGSPFLLAVAAAALLGAVVTMVVVVWRRARS